MKKIKTNKPDVIINDLRIRVIGEPNTKFTVFVEWEEQEKPYMLKYDVEGKKEWHNVKWLEKDM